MTDNATDNTKTLKTALIGNATFSTLSAAIFLLFTQDVAALIGLKSMPELVIAVGVGLLGFMAYIVLTISKLPDAVPMTKSIILGDWGWVLASVIVLAVFANAIPGPGLFAIAFVAAIVAGFALWQTRGLKKLA